MKRRTQCWGRNEGSNEERGEGEGTQDKGEGVKRVKWKSLAGGREEGTGKRRVRPKS